MDGSRSGPSGAPHAAKMANAERIGQRHGDLQQG